MPIPNDAACSGNTSPVGALRLDVLVQAKQVRRVVPALDLRQTLVVGPVALAHAVLPFVRHEIDVGTPRRMRTHRLPIALDPPHVGIGVMGHVPEGILREGERRRALRKGGGVGGDPAHGATKVIQMGQRHCCSLLLGPRQHVVDHCWRDRVEVVRLGIGPDALREERIERRLECRIGYGPDPVGHGLQRADGSDDVFAVGDGPGPADGDHGHRLSMQ